MLLAERCSQRATFPGLVTSFKSRRVLKTLLIVDNATVKTAMYGLAYPVNLLLSLENIELKKTTIFKISHYSACRMVEIEEAQLWSEDIGMHNSTRNSGAKW